jgi:beta-glucosidase/6-phospho-beta-glucosidase/beta-galactosidase
MNSYRFSVEWSRIEPHPGDLRMDVLENYYVHVAAEKASILRVKVPSCQLPDSGT